MHPDDCSRFRSLVVSSAENLVEKFFRSYETCIQQHQQHVSTDHISHNQFAYLLEIAWSAQDPLFIGWIHLLQNGIAARHDHVGSTISRDDTSRKEDNVTEHHVEDEHQIVEDERPNGEDVRQSIEDCRDAAKGVDDEHEHESIEDDQGATEVEENQGAKDKETEDKHDKRHNVEIIEHQIVKGAGEHQNMEIIELPLGENNLSASLHTLDGSENPVTMIDDANRSPEWQPSHQIDPVRQEDGDRKMIECQSDGQVSYGNRIDDDLLDYGIDDDTESTEKKPCQPTSDVDDDDLSEIYSMDSTEDKNRIDIRMERSTVERLIDRLQQDGNPFADERKARIKKALRGIYQNDIFDLEFALQKNIDTFIKIARTNSYLSYIVAFSNIIRSACEDHLLDFDYNSSEVGKVLTIASVIHQEPAIERRDEYRANFDSRITWERLFSRVRDYVRPISRALRKKEFHQIETYQLETALRAMLYVCENPPRRDEYRTLLCRRPMAKKNCNYFDHQRGVIVLEDYATAFMYGSYEIQLSNESTELLYELCRRRDAMESVFLFGTRTEDVPLDQTAWEETCMLDFDKICGEKLDTLALRTLYLSHYRSAMSNDSIKRIQTIASMGHSLREHITLSRLNMEETNAKRSLDSDANNTANKTRRIE
jgi:hypothetical protein